ncbi:MAG: nucleotidyl transferase AbiEii/AbiGii toxin family protein [Proteobacteria bacterium]|nr:nucleotidyl transferase AbiEii/AbiGii toxin family protein [Pseudomonadota bacterium]MCH9711914.1 nucleotidyl transferase AbiEii/AbiGii toxin family protein [Pseudomonadota bacterium]MCH9750266.1 nucleotidyl transferase AbiEii/AbiGii toxin family protein [Pseudomonadota bacterium]
MNLHANRDLFKQAIVITAQKIQLPEIYVEKDYWVTFTLHSIFHSKLKNSVIFKGGTALSKCYGMIDRFSEDIDLVLLRDGSESSNQLKNKLKAVSELISEQIPEVERIGITNKKGMIRKTAHNYPKVFKGEFAQVRNDIIIETGWLGSSEPYEAKSIQSYIYDAIVDSDVDGVIEKFDLSPFTINTLSISRTLCEKIMSLVRFSCGQDPIKDLNNKIRHIYDIHQLLNNNQLSEFFNSKEFDDMLMQVAIEDISSFKNNKDWISVHPKEALIFSDIENTWAKLSKTYNTDFSELVFGNLPAEKDVIATLAKVAGKLSTIDWMVSSSNSN